jgi:hypothetical protein
MKELSNKWFSNPRPLPLNKNGQIDFSLDKKDGNDKVLPGIDPSHDERFMGRLFREILMPDGGKIILLIHWDDADPDLPFQVKNHNVFRVDSNGDIIWQVERKESDFVNWESRNSHAKKEDPCSEGYIDSFIAMSENFFERRQIELNQKCYPKFEEFQFSEYKPGRLLWLTTRWWAYDLDPESGIATCTGEQIR